MNIYDGWEHYIQYLDPPDLNDPTLSNEQIKQAKLMLDKQVENDKLAEEQRIREAAQYIGVSIEEYLLMMNK